MLPEQVDRQIAMSILLPGSRCRRPGVLCRQDDRSLHRRIERPGSSALAVAVPRDP
jgi:hypothetical protein